MGGLALACDAGGECLRRHRLAQQLRARDLIPSVIERGESEDLDVWIYVTDSDPTFRNSLGYQTYFEIRTASGEWRIDLWLSSISFTDTVMGNDDMEAASCLHSPDNPKIQQYAQYAAGACAKINPADLAEVCSAVAAPSNNRDPDSPEQAVRNLVNRVHEEFAYSGRRYSQRVIDMQLLSHRGAAVGQCMHYSDLTTGLLRSLHLPTRTVAAVLHYDPAYSATRDTWGAVGHQWSEAYLGGTSEPLWKQADSTWDASVDQQGVYEADERFDAVSDAWADRFPLSSASSSTDERYLCVKSCYLQPIRCSVCFRESRASSPPPPTVDTSCVADVQPLYHFAAAPASKSASAGNGLIAALSAPANTTRGQSFSVSGSVTNETSGTLTDIITAIATREYANSTEDAFQVDPPSRVIDVLAPGQTATLAWSVTPLVSGTGLRLRFSAESGAIFDQDEQPLVANEPGTSPDLSLTGVCGIGNALPGDTVTLTANVLDEELREFVDPGTTVTARVTSRTDPGFDATVPLAYCESCGGYQGALVLPTTALVGDYTVDFSASHPDYDPAEAATGFFVTPLLTVDLAAGSNVVGVLDPVAIVAQVTDRGEAVIGASVSAQIVTPRGSVTIPLSFDSASNSYRFTLYPADLAGNLDGQVVAGAWQVTATANYEGVTGTDQASITVLGSYPLSEVSIAKSGSSAVLTWPHMGSGVDHYEIYRSTTPYFIPGGSNSVKLTPEIGPAPAAGDMLSFADTGGFAEPITNYFYVVQPVIVSGQPYGQSNGVAGFSFVLATEAERRP